MAQRRRIRRKRARSAPTVRRQVAGPAPRQQETALAGGLPGGLMVGGAMDPAEKRADATAARIMQMTAPVPLVRRQCAKCAAEDPTLHRKCAECAAEEDAARRTASAVPAHAAGAAAGPALAAGAAPAAAPRSAAKAVNALGSGRPLPATERAFFESRFGQDLSGVRIHDGPDADRANRAIDARAFSRGSDIAFARGEYAPGTHTGRHLMAHELAHVTGQDSESRLRRAPTKTDPLCKGHFLAFTRVKIIALLASYMARKGVEERMALVRALKMVHRCGTATEAVEIKTLLIAKLGTKEGAQVWAESKKPLGGYRGAYPGYYGGAKSRVKGLGASEAVPFDPFTYKTGEFQTKGAAAAKTAAPIMKGVDLLYFYGHQYAQYKFPGVFANGNQTQYIDLKKLEAEATFTRVKLIISTSCATICKEAIEVFSKVFPNAVILGYRKSAPIKGDSVRNAFDKGIRGLKKPLFLDQPVDVSAIITVWKGVVKAHHPREATRLPGYYQGGVVHYLENGKWKSMSGTDAANACREKGSTIEEAH